MSPSSPMRFYISLAVAFLILVAVFALLIPHARPTQKLDGHVLSGNEPVDGASVRFQGHILSVLSKSDGTFALPVLSHSSSRITACKEGFFIGSCSADTDPLIVKLTRLPAKDN